MSKTRSERLVALLTEHLPNHRKKDGSLCFRQIGLSLDISRQAVGQWAANGFIPPQRVKSLVELNGSTLTREALLEFVDLG